MIAWALFSHDFCLSKGSNILSEKCPVVLDHYIARCLVGEHPADFDLLQLPFRVLVEAADPDIADALTLQDASQRGNVRKKSMTFRLMCQ